MLMTLFHLARKIYNTKKRTKTYFVPAKEAYLEVPAEKAKYVIMSAQDIALQNDNKMTPNLLLENSVQSIYREDTLTH
jgi:hypothetical protein